VTPVALATPSGLGISSGVLTWTAVANASSYTVKVNTTEHAASSTSMNLASLSLAAGTYSVSVRANGQGNYTNSAYSSTISYTVEPTVTPLSAPQNIDEEDMVLSWATVENATSYVVKVGSTEIPATTNSLDLSTASLPYGKHQVSVQAKGQGQHGDSVFSSAIEVTVDMTSEAAKLMMISARDPSYNSLTKVLADFNEEWQYDEYVDAITGAEEALTTGGEFNFYRYEVAHVFKMMETFQAGPVSFMGELKNVLALKMDYSRFGPLAYTMITTEMEQELDLYEDEIAQALTTLANEGITDFNEENGRAYLESWYTNWGLHESKIYAGEYLMDHLWKRQAEVTQQHAFMVAHEQGFYDSITEVLTYLSAIYGIDGHMLEDLATFIDTPLVTADFVTLKNELLTVLINEMPDPTKFQDAFGLFADFAKMYLPPEETVGVDFDNIASTIAATIPEFVSLQLEFLLGLDLEDLQAIDLAMQADRPDIKAYGTYVLMVQNYYAYMNLPATQTRIDALELALQLPEGTINEELLMDFILAQIPEEERPMIESIIAGILDFAELEGEAIADAAIVFVNLARIAFEHWLDTDGSIGFLILDLIFSMQPEKDPENVMAPLYIEEEPTEPSGPTPEQIALIEAIIDELSAYDQLTFAALTESDIADVLALLNVIAKGFLYDVYVQQYGETLLVDFEAMIDGLTAQLQVILVNLNLLQANLFEFVSTSDLLSDVIGLDFENHNLAISVISNIVHQFFGGEANENFAAFLAIIDEIYDDEGEIYNFIAEFPLPDYEALVTALEEIVLYAGPASLIDITKETFTDEEQAHLYNFFMAVDRFTMIMNGESLAPTPTDLFFSEYIEGSSNNKAFEIYNGTPYYVFLANYNVKLYTNGSPTPGSTYLMLGVLAPQGVFVIANASANATILAIANVTSGVANYNGDDAIVLYHGTEIIDSIGQVGVDPGAAWVSGDVTTLDRTLVRIPATYDGDIITNDAYDPSLYWNVFPIDTLDYLGSHLNDLIPD
jgi:P pilus assembly chaperone PapD